MLRRLTSLLMLLTLTYSSAESVVGVLRDGDVHHESMARAATHAMTSASEHVHASSEEGAPDDSQHEHGTGADHCTHQHGAPLIAPTISFVAFAVLQHTPPSEPVTLIDRVTDPLKPPPQA